MNHSGSSEPFDELLRFLEKYSASPRKNGETYFRRGAVLSVASRGEPNSYVAEVKGSALYQVTLTFDNGGWKATCTCPVGWYCKHIYAAGKALLAEMTSDRVRDISSLQRVGQPSGTKAGRSSRLPEGIATIAERTLGRELTRPERAFCSRIHSTYNHCAVAKQIGSWDFAQMGFQSPGPWGKLEIWPEFPGTELEFWLYVAYALQSKGIAFPDFVVPITDFSVIESRLAEWEKARHVEHWKKRLEHCNRDEPFTGTTAREIELRLVIGATGATLESKAADAPQYARIKQSQWRDLLGKVEEGAVRLSVRSQALLQCFDKREAYNSNATALKYNDPNGEKILGIVLRTPGLETCIVDEAGQPLRFDPEPLRWKMEPPQEPDGLYTFYLTKADGTLTEIFADIDGTPSLYVCRDAIYSGPPSTTVLDPRAPNHIPSKAIETSAGLQFLHRIGAPIPPALRDRLKRIGYEVTIECELAPLFNGSDSEVCLFHARAKSLDNEQELIWSEEGWVEEHEHRFGASKSKRHADDALVVYDRQLLIDAGQSLSSVDLKRTGHRAMGLRVNKQFPNVFAAWLKSIPPQIHVELKGELASFVQETVAGRVKLEVSEAGIDWFDLRVVLDIADTLLTANEIKLLLNAKGNFVRLEGKGWRRLQFDLTAEEDERLANLGLTPHEFSAEPQRLHVLQLADEAAKKFLPAAQVEQIQRRASEIKTRVTPEVPMGITATLRPYQVQGFHFLAYLSTNRFGGVLADDMGLGKTLQTLAWLMWLREQTKKPAPSLVVCPKSVTDNWRAETERFASGLRVKVWASSDLNQFKDKLNDADVHVLNYSQLRILGESLPPIRWLSVILDEGQYIKNPSSQTAQIARSLNAEYRLVLSGTPIENRLLDLWSLMAFAMPGVLSSRNQFAKLYDAKDDPFARKRLAARVRPFLLRRTKSQVAKDLPDRIEEDLFCEIEGQQKTLYRAELKRAQQLLLGINTQKQLNHERFHLLTSLLRLRQICCHPALVNPDYTDCGAKMEALLEQLEPLMAEGHKVLVFSQFVELLALLKPAITERGWPMFYLAGETENRGELVRQFQSAEGGAVFLISLKAGGFGLNLTAASYVVLFDPWWNPAVENQAIDRTHRIGQVNKVIAYRLLIKDSIEEKIRSLQKQKSALADDVLGEERFAQSLSISDLQFLFAD